MKAWFLAVASAVALVGCAAPTAEGQRVRVVTAASVVEGCEMLRALEERSGWGSAMSGVGHNNNLVARA